MKFKCDFGSGVICEMEVQDTAPVEGGAPPARELRWTGNPTPALWRPYVEWCNSVNQIICNTWGIPFNHVFLHPTEPEAYEYIPGGQPRRVQKIRTDATSLMGVEHVDQKGKEIRPTPKF